MQPSKRAAGRGNIWAALVTVWIVWGTTYLAIAVSVRSLPPLLAGGVRFLLAGTLLYAWAIRRGDREGDRPTRRHWRSAAIIGALLLMCSNGMIMVAEKTVPSGLTALIVAMVPLWIAFFDRILFGRRLQPRVTIGLITGFFGAALLVGGSIQGDKNVAGTVMVIGAALSWTLGSLYARDARLPARPLVGTAMEMLAGGAMLVAAGVIRGELSGLDPSTFRVSSMLALLYLVVFGSLVGYSSYVWLIRSAPTELASTYAYVNPVVAVSLGSVILNEPLTARTVLAGAIVVVSVALIVTTQGKPATPGEEAEAVRAASGE
jgi:drug/metabolite transporter (DMT)-like permease